MGVQRTLLVLVALLLGIIAALLTGILVASGGTPLTSAVLAGGGAFATVVPLVLGLEYALGLFGLSRD